MKLKVWIEAMRLRTLPVSVAGVIMGTGYAVYYNSVNYGAAALCLLFAVLAQIASNFANEYYDFRDGLDKPGRVGPRRGVTEGDITPRGMLIATFGTLVAACVVGLSLLMFGPWWLIPVGAAIGLGVLAYSTGPYPLSRHGLGEVAVLMFFGVIPVNLTYFLQSGMFCWPVFMGSVSAGLMGANVLLVNNYRDEPADRMVGKNTLAVLWGRKAASTLYLLNGYLAIAFMWRQWLSLGSAAMSVPAVYLLVHTALWLRIIKADGTALNPMLGITAMLMLCYAVSFALIA
jgi:1,4-dihydroxy-2-naphthoate octaprenyltransferase